MSGGDVAAEPDPLTLSLSPLQLHRYVSGTLLGLKSIILTPLTRLNRRPSARCRPGGRAEALERLCGVRARNDSRCNRIRRSLMLTAVPLLVSLMQLRLELQGGRHQGSDLDRSLRIGRNLVFCLYLSDYCSSGTGLLISSSAFLPPLPPLLTPPRI